MQRELKNQEITKTRKIKLTNGKRNCQAQLVAEYWQYPLASCVHNSVYLLAISVCVLAQRGLQLVTADRN